MKALQRLALLAALPSVAMLGGCWQTPTSDPTVTKKAVLDVFKPLGSSTRDTCETQRQIAAHNSAHDTFETGRETVYQAPCAVKRNGKTEAKTS
jgi:hypothetical protein